LVSEIETWIANRSGWPPRVTSIARKWLDEGIKDRCITRDLAWGVPVPKPGYEGKVFYVWFDAPIAYLAATKEWADTAPGHQNWRLWWWEPQDASYIQFLGKDNVPFHAVTFPCTLIGSGEPWKTVDIIKGFNWLTYEGGKFSTSLHRGVFLDQALDLLGPDYWRWWLASNSPESGDTDFTFSRFATEVSHDLADSFGNLVHRTLKFLATCYDGIVPGGGQSGEAEQCLAAELNRRLQTLRSHHDNLALRKSADEVRSIWRLANGYLAAQAPWSLANRNPGRSAIATRIAVNLVAVAATISWPFIPDAADRVLTALRGPVSIPPWPWSAEAALFEIKAGQSVRALAVLFSKVTSQWSEELRKQFTGGLLS
jgi:methionyl-tRNA synthetase